MFKHNIFLKHIIWLKRLLFVVISVLEIGCALYSWCDRCYINACMIYHRVRRPLLSANSRATRDSNFTKAKR